MSKRIRAIDDLVQYEPQLALELEKLLRRHSEADEMRALALGLEELLRRHPEKDEVLRRVAREVSVRLGVPRLIEAAEGTLVGASRGEEPVEVVPSYCERLLALDDLIQYGLGTEETISSLRARLEGDVARELGISLDELRAQCTD